MWGVWCLSKFEVGRVQMGGGRGTRNTVCGLFMLGRFWLLHSIHAASSTSAVTVRPASVNVTRADKALEVLTRPWLCDLWLTEVPQRNSLLPMTGIVRTGSSWRILCY